MHLVLKGGVERVRFPWDKHVSCQKKHTVVTICTTSGGLSPYLHPKFSISIVMCRRSWWTEHHVTTHVHSVLGIEWHSNDSCTDKTLKTYSNSCSVADPGYLSRIRIFFSTPDPGSGFSPMRIQQKKSCHTFLKIENFLFNFFLNRWTTEKDLSQWTQNLGFFNPKYCY